MAIGKCKICGADCSLWRCEVHARCDGCGTRDGFVYRAGGVWCDACHKKSCEQQIASFKAETKFTGQCVCPWCGYVQSDAWEMGEGTHECGNCERSFEMSRDVDVTYSTKRIQALAKTL